ncbi:MAG: histone family protein [Euryarchaeota archaeon]|nr:histone family protein [Euryarchaeota archaeon]
MGELPASAVLRIIRKATNMRVGRDAGVLLAEILEEIGTELATEAGKYAKHAGRKTVKASDLKLAYKG